MTRRGGGEGDESVQRPGEGFSLSDGMFDVHFGEGNGESRRRC